MLVDEREQVKKLAVRRVLAARQKTTGMLRVFKVLKVNFLANDYIDLID